MGINKYPPTKGEKMIKPLHEVPPRTSLWGYDHCPAMYNKPCKMWAEALSDGSIVAGLMKLVSGAKLQKDGLVFSRAPDSWISLDTFSFGFAHWWAMTAPKLLSSFTEKHRELSVYAFGDHGLDDLKKTTALIDAKRGKMPHNKKYDWLLAGWWEIGQHPDLVRHTVDYWIENYTNEAMKIMKEMKWENKTSFVGLCRIANSRGNGGMRSMFSTCLRENKKLDENSLMKVLFDKYYNYPQRWVDINSYPEFNGKFDFKCENNLKFDRSLVKRVDGSLPKWLMEENKAYKVKEKKI